MRALILAFGGIVAGLTIAGIAEDRRNTIFAEQLQSCGYHPHPIADVAWELYRRGFIPAPTAIYYSNMTSSRSSVPKLRECVADGRISNS